MKPKRNVLKAQRNLLRVNFNAGNIYIGKGTSTDNIYLGFEDPCQPASRTSYCSAGDASSALAPLARLSDICALSTTTNASTSVEIVCEVCSQVVQSRNGETSCQCGVRRSSYASYVEKPAGAAASASASGVTTATTTTGAPKPAGSVSPVVDKDYVNKQLETAARVGPPGAPFQDVLSASYFDVAVLRCLFCPQWAEEGVYWALRYIHQRLLEVCDENSRVEYTRERSQSLPSPHLKVSTIIREQRSYAILFSATGVDFNALPRHPHPAVQNTLYMCITGVRDALTASKSTLTLQPEVLGPRA